MTRLEQEARVQATFDTVACGYDHPMLSWFGSTANVIAQASRLVDAEQESDYKQRHLQGVQALLDAGTTRLDVGVLVAMSEKE